MLKAVKANKEYTITEELKKRYLEDGYDIHDEKGNVIEYSPKKKIEYSKYAALEKERVALAEEKEKLRKEIEKLKKKSSSKNKETPEETLEETESENKTDE